MAIAKMEKLTLTFKDAHLDEILRLMQEFQGIHIETGYEASIPPAKKAEIDKTIRETEKSLQEIQAARNIIKGRKQTNILDTLMNSEEKKMSIAEFVKIVEESDWENVLEDVIHTDRWLRDNRKRRKDNTKLQGLMEIWEPLGCNPLKFCKLHRAAAYYGSVHLKHMDEFSEILQSYEDDGVAFENVHQSADRVYFLIFCHSSMIEKIDDCMNYFSFSAEEYPFDKPQAEAKKELEAEESKLLDDEKEINRLIDEQSRFDEILAFAEDYNLNILLRQRISLEVIYNDGDVEIEGWIVSDKREQFEKLISKSVPDSEYKLIINSVNEDNLSDVPIKLKNSRLATVYERLTEMYSLPRYDEIDPTPVVTIFYLIFFGLMVSDLGYGFAVFLVGLLVRKVFKVKRSTKSFVNFLYFLSFPTMGWGLVFGTFFGFDLPFGLLNLTIDIIPITLLSLVLGYLHIMTGLVLNMINQGKLGKYHEMVSEGLAWFTAFLGGGVAILAAVVPWFQSNVLLTIGIAIALLGVAALVITPAIQYGKRWLAGFGKGLYSLYGAMSYMGDFISYARLMALGVAGGSVALAFNTIIAYLPLPARLTIGIVLAIVLHAMNIFLSMLSAYVHAMRLQFIEFFGKFYTGGGKRFQPFKAAEKNIIIVDKE